jgi:hypothetical protein
MSRVRIVLTQNFGKFPGDDPANERKLEVELNYNMRVGTSSENRWLQMLSKNFHAWGTYKITENWGKDSAGIGMMESSSQLKFWAFSQSEWRIYFGTIKTNLSDGAGRYEPDEIRKELYLDKAAFNWTSVSGIGGSPYTGQVLADSWIALFQKGIIYWDVYYPSSS